MKNFNKKKTKKTIANTGILIAYGRDVHQDISSVNVNRSS